jgi:hypothetical protein
MSDVKLTREGLRAALMRASQSEAREHPMSPADAQTLIAAARALLAATEPASDEEIRNAVGMSGGMSLDVWTSRVYRAAEARVRRLAFG